MPPDDPSQRSSSADLPESAPQNEPPPKPNFDLTSGEKTKSREAAKTTPAGDPTPANTPPAASSAPLGRIRDYELLEKLGEGGMGAVYKALHVKLKRPVAVKILPREKLVDAQAVARFNREMEAVGQLVHPNIVLAHDAGEADGQHYLVMELVEGMDLTQLVARLGPLPVADACELVRQATLGLEHAHRFGLVHRDIKPSNLILTSAGQTKILDLGLALLNSAQPASGLTGDCQVMGTADYMAPEQAVDSHAVDIRADIYSLGCTLYKLLTGEPPFAGAQFRTPLNKLMAHAQTAPVPVYQVRGGVPAELSNIIGRMLAKSPAERHSTPHDIALTLKPFCKGSDLAALYARAAGRPAPVPVAPESETASSAASASQQTNNAIESRMPPDAAPPVAASPTTQAAIEGSSDRAMPWPRFAIAAAAVAVLVGLAFLITNLVVANLNRQTARIAHSSSHPDIGGNQPSPPVVPSPIEEPREGPEEAASDASPEQPAKAQLVWPTRHVDREVAERVIKTGGAVGVTSTWTNLRTVADLPARPFHLQGIDLSGCQPLALADFELIGRLRYLQKLAANVSWIANEHVTHLRHLRTLEILEVEGATIDDAAIEALLPLKRIWHLNLSRTKITDRGMQAIARMREHEGFDRLNLSGTAITDAGLEPLAAIPVVRLHLSGTEITDAGLKFLGAIKGLEDLDLQSTGVNGKHLDDLAPAKCLHILNLSFTKVDDDAVRSLTLLPSLRSLMLGRTNISDDAVKTIAQMQELRFVDVQNTKITDAGGEQLGKALTKSNLNQEYAKGVRETADWMSVAAQKRGTFAA
jgi:serine/threonine protein kinase